MRQQLGQPPIRRSRGQQCSPSQATQPGTQDSDLQPVPVEGSDTPTQPGTQSSSVVPAEDSTPLAGDLPPEQPLFAT
eukprot:11193612-Lingulodinium_polyedra.AAC.1